MSDNKEQFPVSAEELVEAEVQDPENVEGKDKHVPQRVKPWHLVALFVVVSLTAVATSGYWFWQQWIEKLTVIADTQRQQAEQQQQLTNLEQQLLRLQSTDSTLEQRMDQSMADMRVMLVNTAQRLNRQADQTENRLPLEEALNLARLAEQRLLLDNNAQVAIRYLQAADQALKPLDDAAVLPLREQLAKDIFALRNVQSVDTTGVYFQLEAIADYISQLTWQPKPVHSQPIEPEQNPIEGFWQSLKNIVVIKRLDVTVQAQPLLTDFEQWRQYSLLLLGQAQLALLAQNQALYNAVLEQLSSHLLLMNSQFSLAAAQSSIAELQQLKLTPNWPAISGSIRVISGYIAQQNSPQEAD